MSETKKETLLVGTPVDVCKMDSIKCIMKAANLDEKDLLKLLRLAFSDKETLETLKNTLNSAYEELLRKELLKYPNLGESDLRLLKRIGNIEFMLNELSILMESVYNMKPINAVLETVERDGAIPRVLKLTYIIEEKDVLSNDTIIDLRTYFDENRNVFFDRSKRPFTNALIEITNEIFDKDTMKNTLEVGGF